MEMWQAVRLTIIQYLKNDKFSSNIVVLFMQKREHPVFRHLYSRNSLVFLPPFLKIYEILKKQKAHTKPSAPYALIRFLPIFY